MGRWGCVSEYSGKDAKSGEHGCSPLFSSCCAGRSGALESPRIGDRIFRNRWTNYGEEHPHKLRFSSKPPKRSQEKKNVQIAVSGVILWCGVIWAQPGGFIEGTVAGEEGEDLSGANITVKGRDSAGRSRHRSGPRRAVPPGPSCGRVRSRDHLSRLSNGGAEESAGGGGSHHQA